MKHIPDRPCADSRQDSEPPLEDENRERPLWRRLSESAAPPQLPREASAKKRRYTYHPREDFTSAWLELNHFKCDHNISSIAEAVEGEADMEGVICNSEKHEAAKSISEEGDDFEKGILDQRRDSAFSVESSPQNDCDEQESQSLRWIDNSNARNSVLIALSAFYALVLTIFALVLELSHLLSGANKRSSHFKDFIFGMYMYGVSILFFLYVYAILLLNPRWYKTVAKFKSLFDFHKSSSESEITCDGASTTAATIHRRVTHDSPSAGSLFLRLGSVVFGVIGIVYYSFSVFLCYSDKQCDNVTALLDIGATVFVFTQMHFVFCNWKISITGSHFIARLGTMHLVAVNLWTWIRYVLIEEGIMEREIRDIFNTKQRNYSSLESSAEVIGRSPISSGSSHERCEGAECVLGSLSELMYTSIVEYSLIGAAVMFTVWKNIDHVRVPSVYVKRKHQIRVDCSKTTTGLFLGLAFLAATFTSMAVFYGYTLMHKNHTAAYVFGITDIIQFVTAMFGCIYALWTMRQLHYHDGPHTPSTNNQELLDKILLSLGMIGELIYSVAGLVGLTGERAWQPLTVVLLFVHVTRLAQVGIQSCLLYIAGKLRIQGNDELRTSQPGKQAITFLLIANIAMFLMNLFESEKAGVSETIVNFYGKKSWVFLVRSFSPLTIFYRFHSSVCFAEVWKNVYAWKS
ncbi:hypothetical protein QR680_002361 [Steinernema hermaphroditum]|uniref:Uncharacterized protein n=1 Tax=Steinernema hermaphroditum TaxID=289476 RepID=A0AA39H3B7_9BILA|nr:hypothetical protein QR680_002361 [Steinernema hermaphroditum]